MKYLCLFVIFLSSIFSSSCVSNFANNIKNPPVKSFVKIWKTIKVTKCNKKKECKTSSYYTTGSGIIIGHTKNHTLVLTAAHVCQTSVEDNPHKIRSILMSIDHSGRSIHSQTILSSNPNTEKRDICLIATKNKIDAKPVKLGKKPSVGDRTYSISAPAGVIHLPAVPILEGIYSGRGKNINNDLYTIPAYGGSSGGGIFNENGELIGIVVATVRNFHHITLSVTHDDLNEFLKEGEEVLEKLNF